MGGYSYKKRNKAVKQSFKNRRSSPRNINIMVGGEEPVDEDLEMVGGDNTFIDKINAGFAAIDNYFKTAFIPKDVNKVYIVKQDSTVETLNRVPPTPVDAQPSVNMNVKIALSIANVTQKAFDVLNAINDAPAGKAVTLSSNAAANAAAIAAAIVTETLKSAKVVVSTELMTMVDVTLAVFDIKRDQNLVATPEPTLVSGEAKTTVAIKHLHRALIILNNAIKV